MHTQSIQTKTNGEWTSGEAPTFKEADAGKEILLLHSPDDPNYKTDGTFICQSFAGNKSRLELMGYSTEKITVGGLGVLDESLSASNVLTTGEDKETFFHNWRAGKYRFSASPYAPDPTSTTDQAPAVPKWKIKAEQAEKARQEAAEKEHEEWQEQERKRKGWVFGPSDSTGVTPAVSLPRPEHVGPREE